MPATYGPILLFCFGTEETLEVRGLLNIFGKSRCYLSGLYGLVHFLLLSHTLKMFWTFYLFLCLYFQNTRRVYWKLSKVYCKMPKVGLVVEGCPWSARGSRILGATPVINHLHHQSQTHRRRPLQTPGGTTSPSSSSKHHENQVDLKEECQTQPIKC